MSTKSYLLLGLCALGCAKGTEPGPERNAPPGIRINEINAVDGNTADGDWLELYNSGNTLHLTAGQWYLTDDRDDLLKYELPETRLAEFAYLRVLCDGGELDGPEPHATFRLAAKGEWLALVQRVNGAPCIVDSVRYPRLHAHQGTYRRYPDGAQWTTSGTDRPATPSEPEPLTE